MLSSRRSRFLVVVLAALFLLPFLYLISTVQAAQLSWTLEAVDAAEDVGAWTSFAIDSVGNLHVSYWDQKWNNLKYAKLTGSTWTIMPVDTADELGWLGTSIAVDSGNNPHISYYDFTHHNLKYARWTGSTWNIQTVDSAGDVGSYSSLALDSNNRAHISYYDDTNLDLKYAQWTGSAWNIQIVDSGGQVGTASSLDLDSNDRPHIAYQQAENFTSRLKYASWSGTAWNFETVEAGYIGSECVSLKLDASGDPHISYFDSYNLNLKYAKKTESTWSTETVDASNIVGSRSSLALDANDSPHIAYFDHYWDDLKYAKLTDDGWFIKNVDNLGVVGDYPSLVLDSTDHPHVVYRDEDNKNLKYARDPDETFGSVIYQAFDSDGDLKFDSVEYTFDVDTTYSGTLPVFVLAGIVNVTGQLIASNSTIKSITSNQPDSFNIIVSLPQSEPEGNYGIYLTVKDDGETLEDYILGSNELYLSPPQASQNGVLTGTVTDQDWGQPISNAEVMIDGFYVYTNSSGQYGISLPAGSYNVTVNKDLYYSTTIPGVGVFAETTTTQDIALERWFYYLDLQVQGSGSLVPPASYYMAEAGSTVDVNATADSSWKFAYWLFDLVNVGSENPFSIFIDNDHVLKAVFIEDSQVGLFNGTVLDAETETPIGGAQIIVDYASLPTDPAGHFELELEAGEYTVFVEADGYQSQERQITIEPDGNTEETFLMQSVYPVIPVIESSNSAGDQKDFFELGETVYVSGSGYEPSTTLNVYLVQDTETWSEGMTIPTRVSGTATQISSNGEGVIPPTVLWSNPQVVGKYDIVVDVNNNGVYDPEVDVLDDGDVEVTAGMVIPEFSPLHFLLLLITLSLFVVLTRKFNGNNRIKSIAEK